MMVPDYALIGEIMLEPQPWVCPKNGGEIQGLCNGEYYHRTWDTDGTDGFWSFFFFFVVFKQTAHARNGD